MSPESKVIRVFVAIRVPANVLAALAEVQNELKTLLPRKSTAWTKPENLHLTLRFLGNVPVASVPELENCLRVALSEIKAFDLICERLGCFPDLRYPRVVWAWVHDTNERLQQLHQRIDEAVRAFAEKPAEQRFVGHITLARPKQIKRVDADRLTKFVNAATNRVFGRWPSNEIVLLRSELSPVGAQYHELARINLSRTPDNTQSC